MADSAHAQQSVDPYLSPSQQDLLLAALNSQAGSARSIPSADHRPSRRNPDSTTDSPTMASNSTLLMSPQDADLGNFDIDVTPDFDYLEGDSFDFENADLGGDMIGALPGSGSTSDTKTNGDGHEKRKSPDENDESDEGNAKRQETQEGEKQAKKPGRKPLTSEPTTKRKAQNRAAQRAFRERKEKHVKDLETKVTELTKSSEADKHENGLLKAQIERLQVELREYRKRLSLNGTSSSRSPPLNASTAQQRSNSNLSYSNNFHFDFPKFGALPGSHIFGDNGMQSNSALKQASNSPNTRSPANGDATRSDMSHASQSHTSRQNSMGRSMSPQSISNTNSPSQFANADSSFSTYSPNDNMHGIGSMLPQTQNSGPNDPFNDLFSPSILKSTSPSKGYFENSQEGSAAHEAQESTADSGNDSTSGLNRVFRFNGGSNASDSTSPSASSTSQWNTNGNGNSSCGTSPEPSHESPGNKESEKNSAQGAFGTPNLQNTTQDQTGLDATFGMANTDFNVSSLGTFDPVLFGDYRDTNEGLLDGGGNFSSGFFDDALTQPYDIGSPSNLFGILQSPQPTQSSLGVPGVAANASTPSQSLMAQVEKTCEGRDDDYGLTNNAKLHKVEGDRKMISCNDIWNQIQSNSDFQEHKFDLDGLCSELRSKARCSESGVLVEQDHVDQALRKLGKKTVDGKVQDMPPLMFEQDSWDNVLKKMQNSRQ